MDGPSNTLLVRLRRNRSQKDWERFYDLYNPLLQFWALKLTSPNEADDLVQDVFLLVMKKLPSFAGSEDRSFLAWLRAVMVNRWRDLGRRVVSRRCVSDTAALDEAVVDDELGEMAATEERDLLIRRALQVMQSDFEPTTWQACWEAVACDRPAAEVAAELGVSVDVVYSASYRVIRRLRSELADAWR
jgi:RNA polymerase sigma-70 factor (ECF subfamily)